MDIIKSVWRKYCRKMRLLQKKSVDQSELANLIDNYDAPHREIDNPASDYLLPIKSELLISESSCSTQEPQVAKPNVKIFFRIRPKGECLYCYRETITKVANKEWRQRPYSA